MTRLSFAWALCAALASCVKSTTLQKFVVLDPIFDTVFVSNQKPLPSVIYFDGDKWQTPPASAVTWQSSDPTILAVNNPSGQIKGLKRGTASVSATVENTQGSEIVVVPDRSEEHTSELQSQSNLVCRLLLEKQKPTADY